MMRRTYWRFVPAALWAALIFTLSSLPKLPEIDLGIRPVDKLAHAGVYGVLMLLLAFADAWPRGRRLLVWWGVAAVYGFSDEVHQAFVPNRTPDVLDWLADVSGALMVVVVLVLWRLNAGRRAVAQSRCRPRADARCEFDRAD